MMQQRLPRSRRSVQRISAAALLAVGVVQLSIMRAQAGDVDDRAVTARSQSSYVLGCGGCHGVDGVSNSHLVPELREQVGWFLHVPEGRGYLVRLPNVAFSITSDQELAELLNYMLFSIAGTSTPPGTPPYTAAEVGQLRKHALTEVKLTTYRAQMVETLITEYHAPVSLRTYGDDGYGRTLASP